jgi:hypothetical protein
MRKIIALTVIAFAAGILVGWSGTTLATSNAAHSAAAAQREPAAASMISPVDMMRRAGQLPAQATVDPF